eukprot:TRINITY_DN4173_c0_g1_i1.p1 TRINITY_DN4173_c0_g1~~TRINITY_DN4173_c0_g1_i1.p1  ORF type:complete len:485 (-),score=120.71 TRINITY_DN4173_c0_g1_i1:1058-2512(-)
MINTNNSFKLKLADITNFEVNQIRQLFAKTAVVNQMRKDAGKVPLSSLAIGAPTLPSNPVIDLTLQQYFKDRINTRGTIDQMEEGLDKFQSMFALSREDTYTPAIGIPETRELGAQLFNEYYHFEPSFRNMGIHYGSTHALYHILMATLNPGENIGVFTPYFPAYLTQAQLLHLNLIEIPSTDNCRPDAKALDEYLETHDIKLLILNDPCNPTGVKYTRQELLDIAAVLEKHQDVILVLDDTYTDLVWTEKTLFFDVANMETFLSRTFVIVTFAKTLAGAPGLRGAITYSPSYQQGDQTLYVADTLSKLQLGSTLSVSNMVQKVMAGIIKAKLNIDSPPEHVKANADWEKLIFSTYQHTAEVVEATVNDAEFLKLVVKPEGAFFCYISVEDGIIGTSLPDSIEAEDGSLVEDLHNLVGTDVLATDLDVVNFFLYTAGVVVVPGSGFMSKPEEGRMRVALTNDLETSVDAIQRMDAALGRLKARS